MIIREYFYDKKYKILKIDFSLVEDYDDFFRTLTLDEWDIKYYSPIIITKNILENIDSDFIKEILEEYFKHNELPEKNIL